jgi:DNA-binding CsgD family transcriptional regulator
MKNKIHNVDEVSYIANLPGIICVKDANYVVSALSRTAANLCGWKSFEQAIGRPDHDMPCKAAEIADEFIKLDRLSITAKSNLQALQVLCYGSDWKVLLSERSPFMEKEGAFAKLYISVIDVTHTYLYKGILLLGSNDNKTIAMPNHQVNYIIDRSHQTLPLTEKQEICLFLLIRGKTMKQIAFIMGISIKTVEDHLNSIKTKLACYTKSQLIEKAIDSGFFYYIPRSLLKTVQDIY